MSDTSATTERATALRRFSRSDAVFRFFTRSSALAILAIFAGILVTLIGGAWVSITQFGVGFLTTSTWNPVTEKFGAWPAIYGTLVSSAIAMILALPLGIGIAIFLTEICPRQLKRPIGIAIELLAGIPSIVYGIWGLFILAPYFQVNIEQHVIDWFDGIPVLQSLFAGPPYGIGLFTAGLILAIMILPFIASVTRDVFETAPPMLKEAAYGTGCTTWEVMWRIVLPFTQSGVVGGAMLALGRALGETMAVTFVIGNAHTHITANLFAPATTISATIANEFAEALGNVYPAAIIECGLILMGLTFTVLAAAQLMLRGFERRAGGRSA
ncbi:MAG TPA: phosphate ABC transporter permease subunit PstC [Rhizomicrobium sp.]|nr:phosphate ABC transporter permease subunit PstC [Rhizomicrobium sp.]